MFIILPMKIALLGFLPVFLCWGVLSAPALGGPSDHHHTLPSGERRGGGGTTCELKKGAGAGPER